jgi:aminopeptidase N
MRAAFVLAALAVSAPLWASADTYPRQPAVDALHYRFAITLSEDSARIAGEAAATFRVLAPVAAIELDLISEARGLGMSVTSVTRDGSAVAFTHQGDRLRLPVPVGVRADVPGVLRRNPR